MPIVIVLKDPQINLICEGDIKDDAAKQYDEMFPNLMVKDQEGNNIVIPLSMDCNIAFIKATTQEAIDKRKKEAEERQNQGPGGRGPGLITKPEMLFPRGRGH